MQTSKPRLPKIVLFDSLPDSSGALVEAALQFRSSHVVRHVLREAKIAPCRACFSCWVAHPGTCVIPDDGSQFAADAIASDVWVLVTLPTFGGFSSALKRAMDRTISIVMPFQVKRGEYTHHPARYKTVPKLVGLAVGGTGEEQSVFTKLVSRLATEYQCASSWVGAVSELTPVTAVESVNAFMNMGGAR
jgi:multimeric flavodoxin WrbA